MSSAKQIKEIQYLYESIYMQNLTENQKNELLMVELYNALVEEGFIDGYIIEDGILYEGVSVKVAKAIEKYGPMVGRTLQRFTGFGLGQSAGGKRRIITTGAGTAAVLDPEKARERAGDIFRGTVSAIGHGASAIHRGIKAASGQGVPPSSAEKKYQLNSFDVFDAIKGHLLDEGYADTEECALKIMANMSEDWRESIVEGIIGNVVKGIKNVPKVLNNVADYYEKNPEQAAPFLIPAAVSAANNARNQRNQNKK